MTGRFAPSPTGPLHFGSLVAAVASYLDARSRGGKWLVRMEDIDTPRVITGADADILRTLERFGLEWDGPVVYQSTRLKAYQEALDRLRATGATYGCSCSRTTAEPCRCTGGPRLRVHFGEDDFTVQRADGIFAYHLAVVVDDEWQEITDVVRGADLLDSTPRQVHLQKLLGYSTPRYVHVPVVTNEKGQKLSKQTLAPPLDVDAAPALLTRALLFLGAAVPAELAGANVQSILTWAVAKASQTDSKSPAFRETNVTHSDPSEI
jgi:glutamyl-Q tRNA(Asp) synthetase